MKNRAIVIVTILAALAAAAYNMRQLNQLPKNAAVSASAPTLEEAPPLRYTNPSSKAIANPDIWNLKPFVPLGQMLSLKEMFKPFYTLNKNGRYESLQRSDRSNERWEFQGIILQGDTRRALIYNTAAKRMKNVGQGDAVDEQLFVRAVSPTSVTLESRSEKKPVIFELRIFNANKDMYASKRKKP